MKRSSARRVPESTKVIGNKPSLRIEDVDAEEEGPFDPLDGQGEESSLYVVHQDYDDPYLHPRESD